MATACFRTIYDDEMIIVSNYNRCCSSNVRVSMIQNPDVERAQGSIPDVPPQRLSLERYSASNLRRMGELQNPATRRLAAWQKTPR